MYQKNNIQHLRNNSRNDKEIQKPVQKKKTEQIELQSGDFPLLYDTSHHTLHIIFPVNGCSKQWERCQEVSLFSIAT